MSDQKKFSTELIKTISRAVEEKIYGSIEVYFEGGRMTQITQRVIKKLDQFKPVNAQIKVRIRQHIKKSGGKPPSLKKDGSFITKTDSSDAITQRF